MGESLIFFSFFFLLVFSTVNFKLKKKKRTRWNKDYFSDSAEKFAT